MWIIIGIVFGIIGFILESIGIVFSIMRDWFEDHFSYKTIIVVRRICLLTGTIILVFLLFRFYYPKFKEASLMMDFDTVISETQPDVIEDLYEKAVPSNAVASSEPPPASDGTRFDAAMAIDDDLLTGWFEYAEGNGKGEWIQLQYDSLVTVAAITIWPGYWVREQFWGQYDEPNYFTFSMFIENRIIGECRVQGKATRQCITVILKQPIVVDAVRVEISGIKRAIKSSYDDIAISEIAVYEKGSRSYVSTSDIITDEVIEKMKSQAEDDYANQIAETWGKGEELQSFTCLGYYFLTQKKQDASRDANEVYLIYKCDVTCDGQPFEYYHFIKFRNLIVNSDGSCSFDKDDYDTPSDKVVTDYGYYYYGYRGIDDLFNTCVQKKASSYIIEDNVNE